MSGTLFDEGRRQFLQVSFIAGVGLVVGGLFQQAAASSDTPQSSASKASGNLAPNAWIRISKSGEVTVVINHSELGQGIFTALAMIAAEELEVDWSKVRTEMASMDPVYANPAFGVQATGGSTGVSTSWEELRKAGAATRELLIAAAAATWGVSARKCRAESGKVVHEPSGRTLLYGELVEKAAGMQAPREIPLKKHRDFKIIGKRIPRLDTLEKIQGKAVFGMDFSLKGLLTAVVVHPPVLGGRLKSFDNSKARSMPGVRHVVPISTGVVWWPIASGRPRRPLKHCGLNGIMGKRRI